MFEIPEQGGVADRLVKIAMKWIEGSKQPAESVKIGSLLSYTARAGEQQLSSVPMVAALNDVRECAGVWEHRQRNDHS